MDYKIPTLVLPGEEDNQPKAEPVTEAPAATEAAPAGAQAAAAALLFNFAGFFLLPDLHGHADHFIPGLLQQQVKSAVRMSQTIGYLAANGVTRVIEIGPGRVLAGFIKRTVDGIETISIDTAEDLKKVLEVCV